MKEKKYAQILSTTTALHTNAQFMRTQVASFNEKCKSRYTEITNGIDTMQQTLQSIAEVAPPLPNSQLETLHRLKQTLDKTSAEVGKELEKPILQYQKDMDKLEKTLEKRILPALLEPCEFDLKKIQRLIEHIKLFLNTCTDDLNNCLINVKSLQIRMADLDELLHGLDLPNYISQATKHLEQASRELALINAQLVMQPLAAKQLKTEFLPLRNALERLRIQEDQSMNATRSRSPSPTPKFDT